MPVGFEDRKQSGSLAAAQAAVTVNMPASSACAFQITGTFTATITFEVSVDESNFVAVSAVNVNTGARATTTTTTGIYIVACAGARLVRSRVSAYTSGTAVVTANSSQGAVDGASLSGSSGGALVDTELPAAVTTLADSQTAPTAPFVNALTFNIDQGSSPFTYSTPRLHDGSSDARVRTISGMVVHSRLYCHNHNTIASATSDVLRSVRAADSFVGLGVLGVGSMGWDGAAVRQIKTATDGTQLVGGLTTIISSTLTRPANTTAYASGDEVTDTGGAIITLTGMARFSGGSGIIQGIQANFSDNWATKPSAELWIFDTTSTPQADNAAFAPADAVVNTAIAVIPLTSTYVGDATGNTGNFAMDTGSISVPFLTVGSANLFLRIVVRNAAQAGANSSTILFRVRTLQD